MFPVPAIATAAASASPPAAVSPPASGHAGGAAPDRRSDFALHKRNVKRMLDGGASEREVDAYLAGEGVTAEQLRNAPRLPQFGAHNPSPLRPEGMPPATAQGLSAQQGAPERTPGAFNDGGTFLERLGDNPLASAMRERLPGLYNADEAIGESRIAAAAHGASSAATMGLRDEGAGLVAAAVPGGQGYRDAVDASRAVDAQHRDRHPFSYTAGEIGGGVAGGGKVLAPLGAVRGGAVAGGVYGAGVSEGGLPERLEGGAMGAAFGAAGGKALDAASGYLAPRIGGAVDKVRDGAERLVRETGLDGMAARLQGGATLPPGYRQAPTPLQAPRNATPSVSDLKGQARELYDEIDNSGSALSPRALTQLRATLKAKLDDPALDFNPQMHRTAHRVLKALETRGDQVTVTGLRNLEKLAARVSGRGKHAGEDGYAAGIVRDHLRTFLRDGPELVPGAGGGKVTGAELSRKGARADKLWSRAKTAEAILDALRDAKSGAKVAGSGGNVDNKVRQAMRKLATGRDSKFLDADTKARLLAIAEGNATRNAGRWFGKTFDPTTGGMSGMLNGYGAYSTGGASLPLNAMGFGMRRMAQGATIRDARTLADDLLRGGPAPTRQGVPTPARPILPAPVAGHAGAVQPYPAPYVMAETELDPWQREQLARQGATQGGVLAVMGGR